MSQSIQAFTLGEIAVRQLNGLFSLNDLHRAAGAARRHEPARFIRLDGTKALIAELGAYPEMGTPSTDLTHNPPTRRNRRQGAALLGGT